MTATASPRSAVATSGPELTSTSTLRSETTDTMTANTIISDMLTTDKMMAAASFISVAFIDTLTVAAPSTTTITAPDSVDNYDSLPSFKSTVELSNLKEAALTHFSVDSFKGSGVSIPGPLLRGNFVHAPHSFENITSTSMGVNFHSSKGSGVPVGADGKQESFRQKIHEGVLASTKNVDSDSFCNLLDPSEKHDLNKYDADETDARCSETAAWALGQHVLSTPMCSPHLPQNVQALPRPQRQKPDLKYTLESSVVVSQNFRSVSKFEFNDAQAGNKQGGTSVGSDQVEEVAEWEHFCASLPSLIYLLPIAADVVLGGELIQVVVVIGLVAVIAAVASASCNLKADGPHHVWDFRNCVTGQDVADTGQDEGKIASPMNGPTCSAAGISLDGNDDYVNVETFQFGGATSFEVLVKYDSFIAGSRIFDFGNGESSDNVPVSAVSARGSSSDIGWAILQGTQEELTFKGLATSNFDSSTWTHVVATVSGTTMKIYKNGVLAGTKTDGHEPNVLTRTYHTIGANPNWPDFPGYMDGTIAYVKMWIGVELQQSDVTTLYEAEGCIASMSSSDDGSDGNFYCINGGTVGGIPGSCTCTCKVGSEGPNCATASESCPAEIGYTGTPPDCIAGPVVLGGSSTGSFYVNGACFGTGSADGTYSAEEACTFTFSDVVGFAVGRFETHNSNDYLTVGGVHYSGTSGPSDGSVTAGQEMTWSSDGGYPSNGFEICTGDPCVASTSPSDDGSDGNFYCINGGTAGGLPGSCTCASCNTGFGGSSCELLACVASTSPSDDGSDGNFYCINVMVWLPREPQLIAPVHKATTSLMMAIV
ncbi:hypothetical protein TrST_g1917 [Triparma strigata]|uniref:EGF-like domain-containing protein n=1 Tax=Triparma strigata TaxID=1606541 RepID=A0A9W7ECH5_9STRA|nr:hypothetical protein TrST_g1917 [Triparma strigata]